MDDDFSGKLAFRQQVAFGNPIRTRREIDLPWAELHQAERFCENASANTVRALL
jgi:hypothetical protein